MARLVALAVALAVASTSCKPREGGSCTFVNATCTSPSEGLFCTRPGKGPGKLERYECRGPKGCYREGSMFRCDQSIASVGDRCDTGSSSAACELGGASMLACTHGVMAKETACRGPAGCSSKAGRVSCDMSLAEPGDPCTPQNEGKSACTPDHKERVDCLGGTHVLAAQCAGPAGCSTNDAGTLTCDGPHGAPGAVCTGEGLAECGVGSTSVLHCRSQRLVADGPTCLGANGCYELGDRILCDQSIAEPGSACGQEGRESCSTDAHVLLVCKAGTFQRERACAGSCTVAAAAKGYVPKVTCR